MHLVKFNREARGTRREGGGASAGPSRGKISGKLRRALHQRLVNVVSDRVNKIYQPAAPEDVLYLVSGLNDSVAVASAAQMDVPTLKKKKRERHPSHS